MVVTTGNKSEMSVGYATLYGDMNGGFNPIKDLYKTEVFRLSRLRNRWKPEGALGPDGVVIPRKHHHQAADGGTAREPEGPGFAAALRRCSTASWSAWSSASGRSPKSSKQGIDRETVLRVDRMLNLAEYKRRQAAPGVKVTLRNFGRDRRYPIVNRFRDPGTPLPQAGYRDWPKGRSPKAKRLIFSGDFFGMNSRVRLSIRDPRVWPKMTRGFQGHGPFTPSC